MYAFVSNERIPVEERDAELNYYELRHDEMGRLYESVIEKVVVVNFHGTVVTSNPIVDLESVDHIPFSKFDDAVKGYVDNINELK